MKCLDTSVLIDILRGKPYTRELVEELDRDHDHNTTSINAFELLAGSILLGPRNHGRAHFLLSRLRVLGFIGDSVEEASSIYARSRSKGKDIPMRDAMVAGIVKANRYKLITCDRKHFPDIEGLDVIVIER